MRVMLFPAVLVLAASSLPALAQQAPAPYTPLLFNPYANHWVFRAEGVPWLCVQDGRCSKIRFERVADEDLPAAAITSLGFADRAFYVTLQHPRHQDGRPQVFRCTADGCSKFELEPGEFTFLGTFAVKQRDRVTGKTAILARHDGDPARSRLLWCADSGCSELPLTRENRYDLAFLGAAQFEGRARFWLRETSGSVLSCAQPEAEAGRLDCERTGLAYPEFPAADAGELDQRALAAAIEDALKRRNIAEAERLLAEAQGRFPGAPQWGQLSQRLAQLRSARDLQLRTEQARRLVADARRYAGNGDFAAADALLQQAARLVPNLPEIAQARAEVARLRAEREQRFRERNQYTAAIEAALAAFRLWEAEYLIDEASRRYVNDPAFRAYRARLAQIRAQAEWQQRLRRARVHVAAARQAIERGEFAQAERELGEAENLAPGLPEIREARADLARERIEAEWRADEIRQLAAAIEAALTRNRLVVAERLLTDAMRRYPRYAGWAGLQRRLDQAKRGADQGDRDREKIARARDLVAKARRAAAEGKFAEAERDHQEAQSLAPALPELAAARTEFARLKREADDKAALRKYLADMRAALQRKDFTAAERALAEAEKLARDAPEVKSARAEFEKAKRDVDADRQKAARVQKLVADARDALQRKDLAAAERAVADAEKLDRDAPAVKAVRAELEAAKRGGTPSRFDEAKLRAAFHGQIMGQLGQQLARYRAERGNKALAYCIDWGKVRADAVPPGPFAIHAAPESEAAVQSRALASCRQRERQGCTCTIVDVNGRNALRVPPDVVQRLNRTP